MKVDFWSWAMIPTHRSCAASHRGTEDGATPWNAWIRSEPVRYLFMLALRYPRAVSSTDHDDQRQIQRDSDDPLSSRDDVLRGDRHGSERRTEDTDGIGHEPAPATFVNNALMGHCVCDNDDMMYVDSGMGEKGASKDDSFP